MFTLNQICSSNCPTIHSVTCVWEWDSKKGIKLGVVGQYSGSQDSSAQHFLVVDNLLTHGSPDDLESEEEATK